MYIPTTALTQDSNADGLTDYPLAFSVDPRNLTDAAGSMAANTSKGHRVMIPRTGTLVDMAIYVVTSSGNIDVGVYDCGSPRTKLWSTGSIACPAATAWRVVGDPNLSVTKGQMYDFVVGADNSSFALARIILAAAAVAQLPAEYTFGEAGTPYIAWTGSGFPLPATLTDGSLVANQAIHGMICRIA